jgi:hypothetical protein
MSEGKTYASFKTCGCITAVAHVATGDKYMSREVGKWIAAGEDVRQVTTEWVQQEAKFSCYECIRNKQNNLFHDEADARQGS